MSLLILHENSYVSVEQADTYFEKRPDAEKWTELTTDRKERYLIQACMDMELADYKGIRTVKTQALSFPRDFETKSNYIPTFVQVAQMEQALWLVDHYLERNEIENMDSLGIKDYGFNDVQTDRRPVFFRLCKASIYFLKPYLKINRFPTIARN